MIHTTYNMNMICNFPQCFNWGALLYAISITILFANFYHKEYVVRQQKAKTN